jgi:hypothetical protein
MHKAPWKEFILELIHKLPPKGTLQKRSGHAGFLEILAFQNIRSK